MTVLLIPEDFRYDQYILRPIFERLFRDFGKTTLRVEVCFDPLLGGDGEALKIERLKEILLQYPMVDMFLLCVDRDGKVGRQKRLDQIEAEFGDAFFAENAWEEMETWLLAGLELPSDWKWQDVRAEVHVKERYFVRYAAERGLSEMYGGGRKELGEEAARNVRTIRRKCREDFDSLARRLEAVV